jgi:2-polyprenyl-3-methyl-5-hydroxy-6-metoxy-1,4-benzoquinol methylase
MDWRARFYEKYVSTHYSSIRGRRSLDDARRQFHAWEAYFGALLPKEKDARILDVGCGNGDLVYWLQSKGYANATGVDLSKEQVQEAALLGIKNIRQGDMRETLRQAERVYDAIVARDVLEHLTKEENVVFVDLIVSALTPQGVFIAQTVNAENLYWGRLRHGDFTHEVAFTAQSVSQLLRVGGFASIAVYPQRPVVHGVFSLARAVLWRLREYLHRTNLLIEIGSARGIFTQNIIVHGTKSGRDAEPPSDRG